MRPQVSLVSLVSLSRAFPEVCDRSHETSMETRAAEVRADVK